MNIRITALNALVVADCGEEEEIRFYTNICLRTAIIQRVFRKHHPRHLDIIMQISPTRRHSSELIFIKY